jgi:hypothetical protein
MDASGNMKINDNNSNGLTFLNSGDIIYIHLIDNSTNTVPTGTIGASGGLIINNNDQLQISAPICPAKNSSGQDQSLIWSNNNRFECVDGYAWKLAGDLSAVDSGIEINTDNTVRFLKDAGLTVQRVGNDIKYGLNIAEIAQALGLVTCNTVTQKLHWTGSTFNCQTDRDANTTYSLSKTTGSGGGIVKLTGSDGSVSQVSVPVARNIDWSPTCGTKLEPGDEEMLCDISFIKTGFTPTYAAILDAVTWGIPSPVSCVWDRYGDLTDESVSVSCKNFGTYDSDVGVLTVLLFP